MDRTDRRRRVIELYAQGLSVQSVAAAVSCDPQTARADLKAAGVTIRGTNKPQTEPRTCAGTGCDRLFRPSPRQLREGYGKFCSRECDHEAHRVYPKPEERMCARDGCDNRFTPTGSNVAYGWGKFCSKRCSALSTGAHEKRDGREVSCAYCGTEFWLYDSQINEVRNFCSLTHWSKYRWKNGIAISPEVASLAGSGRARQRWGGRWSATKDPAPGARPRGRPQVTATAAQLAEIRRLANAGWGRRAIANRLLLSERLVRNALDR